MLLLIFAIIATLCSLGFAVLVFFANGMSSNPSAKFEGGYTTLGVFALTALLWTGWALNW